MRCTRRAAHFDLSVDTIERALFADRPAEYVLAAVGQAWTPADLIGRYNLELARGVLYWSSQMRVDIHDGYKDFWRYLKLFKLMFEAQAAPRRRLSCAAGRRDFAVRPPDDALWAPVRRLSARLVSGRALVDGGRRAFARLEHRISP
ncbi:MAG: DUF790 family protein [Chloroflexi bacterium]|nr:DUF790 family protein [Chloroflexota bacterium]